MKTTSFAVAAVLVISITGLAADSLVSAVKRGDSAAVTQLICLAVKRRFVANTSRVRPARASPNLQMTVSMNDLTWSLILAGTGR